MKRIVLFILFLFFLTKAIGQTVHEKDYRSVTEAIKDSDEVRKLTLSGDSLNKFSERILKLRNLEEIALESSDNFDVNYAISILVKLKNLKKLWISDIKISSFNKIGDLKNLEELDLDNVGFMILPAEISNLRRLREINLEENPQLNITQVCNVLSNIQTLKVLWLGQNKLSTLPTEITKLKSLEDLWLEENEFSEIPASVKKLKIKYLSFFDNKLKSLNLKKGDLRNLNNINLCYNNFKVFPAIELSLLPNLDTIKMWYAHVKYIPTQIAKIKKLKSLNLENNSIAKLPTEMVKLKNLSVLELSQNNLSTDGVKCVYKLQNLTKLDISKNNITKISPEIEKLRALKELDICENPITEIPQSCYNLQKLTKVQLGYYKRFDWAAAISILGKLPNLNYVGLFKMNLSKMPDGFEKLGSVREFWMNWNIFDNQEKARIK
jgi:Leucine-rich repeat (LRR) protein